MKKESCDAVVDQILAHYEHQPSALIAVMQDVQAQYRYLPAEAIEQIAEGLGISVAKAYSVATFYENFSLEAKGKHIIRICDGTACHVRRSIPILEALRRELGVSEKKKTTDDMLFTLETVSCLGACGLAPVMTLDDKVHPAMTPEKALALIDEIRKEEAADA
ncbi:MAG: NAD(P)H-dependent oxidoreductase subunit E [Oscillospiraceae bacterium]|nr:NAD(P)H-dependent oxidoreductase subunit E [Oscillospiraceae bacterium]MCM0704778.1 NAD(P)H-dependent oxidoreductase subunit E [Faecalicatena sp. BF-R-105]MDY3217966.1 NAD(P)H-dependent oxidoreductase subunit E [Candidatus Fimivivens sp.]GKH49538.1 NADH dehydrogenase [Eubacteriales bacterium]MCI6026895.1 NAD(P)H-dependent oxidoreductase subunit E [Oscillospiraceae bacterium]